MAFRVLKRRFEGYHLYEQVCAINDCVCKAYDAMHSDVVNGDHIHDALRLAGGVIVGGLIHPSMWHTLMEAKTIPILQGSGYQVGDISIERGASQRTSPARITKTRRGAYHKQQPIFRQYDHRVPVVPLQRDVPPRDIERQRRPDRLGDPPSV